MDDSIKEMALQTSPPWYEYHRKILALFGRDGEIHIRDLARTGHDSYTLLIMISNLDKAAALKAILRPQIDFGGTVLTTTILGPDEDSVAQNENEADTFTAAFSGNPLFLGVFEEQLGYFEIDYCVFTATVLQFYNDNLSDYCGNLTILPADLAKEILVTEKIQFCTEQI